MNLANKLINIKNFALAKKNQSARPNLWGEARTRILICYATLMAGLIGVSIPIFSQLVLNQVNDRVRRDLREDVVKFEQFVYQGRLSSKIFESRDLIHFLISFFYYRIPEDDTFFIIIIDGRFRGSSPKALPIMLRENSVLMKGWANLKQAEEGEVATADWDIGDIMYSARPIVNQGKVRGVFVAVHTTVGEIREATDLIDIVIKVLMGILFLTLILAWIASGKVLTPLRILAATARSISKTDLNQRISVQGSGELAELAFSFNEMMDRLQVAFNTQKEFISDASHELRTPITIIRGHLELLEYDDPTEQAETITLVLDELDRMSRMVEELLMLARFERPDCLELENVNLSLFTQELFAKAKALAPRPWQLVAIAQGNLLVDRQLLTQAMMNLAENATQHTNEADTIELGSAFEGNMVRFWVRDSGEGIADSEQQRVFERFARAGNRQCRSDGTGLGLSIVKAIAQAHGGGVELVSQLTVGSTFTLVLPRKSPPLLPKQG